MYDQHDVNDETLGIRALKVKKAQAASRAIEKLRRGMAEQWSSLGDREIQDLEWVLGEMWAVSENDEWDDLRFSTLALGDVIAILDLGTHLKRHDRGGIDLLHEALGIVRSASEYPPSEEVEN